VSALTCTGVGDDKLLPGWQVAAAWLLAVAVAAAIYFVPVTRLVEVLIPAEITADAE
jgi:hypothetical protein